MTLYGNNFERSTKPLAISTLTKSTDATGKHRGNHGNCLESLHLKMPVPVRQCFGDLASGCGHGKEGEKETYHQCRSKGKISGVHVRGLEMLFPAFSKSYF